jgi:hypothetical protein
LDRRNALDSIEVVDGRAQLEDVRRADWVASGDRWQGRWREAEDEVDFRNPEAQLVDVV